MGTKRPRGPTGAGGKRTAPEGLPPEVRERLLRQGVRIETQDHDTLLLLSVPTSSRCFNKPRTNLLIKRPAPGMPFLVGVDSDLEYTGANASLTRAFAAAERRRGWCLLLLAGSTGIGLGSALDRALEAVGFAGREPALDHPAGAGPGDDSGHDLLDCLAVSLSRAAREGVDEPTVGREEQLERLFSALLAWHSSLPLLVGAGGTGKTNLLAALARRLLLAQPEANLLSVDLGQLFAGTLVGAERETVLQSLLDGVRRRPGHILALERLELLLVEVPHGAFQIAAALDTGARLIGTTVPEFGAAFEESPLASRLTSVPVTETGPQQTLAVLAALLPVIERHHDVSVSQEGFEAAVAEASRLPGHLPGKAVALLDAAAARARLAGAEQVEAPHVYLAARSGLDGRA